MKARRSVVKLLARVAEILHLESETVHRAMVYTDRHQASVVETRGIRVAVTALACLVIATKFGETCQDRDGLPLCPPMSYYVNALQEVCGHSTTAGLTPRHLAAYELRALDVLRWRLRVATPITYARAFRHKGIFCASDATDSAPLLPEEEEQAWKYVQFFCDLATQCAMSIQYGVAVSACASVAAARRLVGIEAPWPLELEQRFGNARRNIEPCVQAMLLTFRQDFPEQALQLPAGRLDAIDMQTPDCDGAVEAADGHDVAHEVTVDLAASVARSSSSKAMLVGASLHGHVNAFSRSVRNTVAPAPANEMLVDGVAASPPTPLEPPESSPTNVDSSFEFSRAATAGSAARLWLRERKRARDKAQDGEVDAKSVRSV